MIRLVFGFCLVALVSFSACQPPPASDGDDVLGNKDVAMSVAEELKGEVKKAQRRKADVDVTSIEGKWVANLLDVRMISVKSIPDSTSFISAKGNDFTDEIGVERMEYWFRKNKSYNIMYRNRDDRIVRTFSGKWSTKNGVLILEETSPKVNTYHYEWTAPFEEDYQARMRGVLDYDYDGEEDDKVVMVLEKLSNK